MFTLQIAIQQLVTRENFTQAQTQITFRFGSIQTLIQLINNRGGKRMVLDLNHYELLNMFKNFSVGLFFINQNGKYFSLLNLQNLVPQDKISGQEVYFYNDLQEIIYTAKLSINFIQYKNPRVPNENKIKNHKKLDEYFRKPEIPHLQVPAKTLITFLYGGQKQQARKNSNQIKNKKGFKKQTMAKTTSISLNKPKAKQLTSDLIKKIQIQNIKDQDEDIFPPPMQFINKQQAKIDEKLKQKLLQTNQRSPEWIKIENKQRSMYSQTLIKTFNKFKKQNDSTQIELMHSQKNLQNKNKIYQTLNQTSINRNQLRDLAKKQIQNYEGKNNVKIPMIKNGKLQLVELKDLSEEQILDYVKEQKIKQQAQKQKQFIRKLQEKQKQNKQLKSILEQQKIKNKQNQIKAITQKRQNQKKSSFISTKKYDQINEEPDYESNSEQEKTQEYDYQSDFESMSIGNSQIKSRISINQKKPKQHQSPNYQQYEEDFQSFSQSQLNYSQKKSNSDISESWRSSYKK